MKILIAISFILLSAYSSHSYETNCSSCHNDTVSGCLTGTGEEATRVFWQATFCGQSVVYELEVDSNYCFGERYKDFETNGYIWVEPFASKPWDYTFQLPSPEPKEFNFEIGYGL